MSSKRVCLPSQARWFPTENDIATTRGLHQSGKITRQTPVNYLCVKLNVDLVFDTFFKENIAKRDFRSEKNRKKVQNTHRLSKIKENYQSRSEAHPLSSVEIMNQRKIEILKEWKKKIMVSENTKNIGFWGIFNVFLFFLFWKRQHFQKKLHIFQNDLDFGMTRWQLFMYA